MRKQNVEEKSSEVSEKGSLIKKKSMRSQKVTWQGHFRPHLLGFLIIELHLNFSHFAFLTIVM